jgi:hypothetical protein
MYVSTKSRADFYNERHDHSIDSMAVAEEKYVLTRTTSD